MMGWKSRKEERTEYYKKYVYKWKLRPCTACNGSGHYDSWGAPPCGACEGTGKERYKDKEDQSHAVVSKLHRNARKE